MTRAWECANQLTKIKMKEREQKKHMNFDEEILLTRQIQFTYWNYSKGSSDSMEVK